MKTIINKFFLASAVVMSLTACSDFLDNKFNLSKIVYIMI